MKLKEIWKNLWETLFPSSSTGFSIKNVMAAAGFTSLMALTFRYTDVNNLVTVLVTWLAFIGGLMGLRTFEKKNDVVIDKNNDSTPK